MNNRVTGTTRYDQTTKSPGASASAARSGTGTPDPTHEQLTGRAYELFVARGRQDGHHEEDWSQAEMELRSGSN
jgi:hypothetical protein